MYIALENAENSFLSEINNAENKVSNIVKSKLENSNSESSQKYSFFIICYSGVTGYGEQLIKSALLIDEGFFFFSITLLLFINFYFTGEVETVAHFRAARHFVPRVDFLLDIGGQDMKCLFIKKFFFFF
jgi:activator of 2-hydroxyglutaryl-CoA dehydratase